MGGSLEHKYLGMGNMMAATVKVDATVPTKANVRMDPMFLKKERMWSLLFTTE